MMFININEIMRAAFQPGDAPKTQRNDAYTRLVEAIATAIHEASIARISPRDRIRALDAASRLEKERLESSTPII